jgi:hypothetical protein
MAMLEDTKSRIDPRVLPLLELSSVVALREIREGDKSVPKGSEGTIVSVHDGGTRYEVEFVKVHVVIAAARAELGLSSQFSSPAHTSFF